MASEKHHHTREDQDNPAGQWQTYTIVFRITWSSLAGMFECFEHSRDDESHEDQDPSSDKHFGSFLLTATKTGIPDAGEAHTPLASSGSPTTEDCVDSTRCQVDAESGNPCSHSRCGVIVPCQRRRNGGCSACRISLACNHSVLWAMCSWCDTCCIGRCETYGAIAPALRHEKALVSPASPMLSYGWHHGLSLSIHTNAAPSENPCVPPAASRECQPECHRGKMIP